MMYEIKMLAFPQLTAELLDRCVDLLFQERLFDRSSPPLSV